MERRTRDRLIESARRTYDRVRARFDNPPAPGPVVRCDVCPSRHWMEADKAEVFYPEMTYDGLLGEDEDADDALLFPNKSNVVYLCPGSLN